jgi:hypothetical protein
VVDTFNPVKDPIESALQLRRGELAFLIPLYSAKGQEIGSMLVEQSISPDQVLESAISLKESGVDKHYECQASILIDAQE